MFPHILAPPSQMDTKAPSLADDLRAVFETNAAIDGMRIAALRS
ncbi:hypothetical protein [Ottowia caeni]